MRYMLLIYTDEKAREGRSPEDENRAATEIWAMIDETTRLGIFRAAEPLHPTVTASTVRKQNGTVMITDGPFAETKEHLAGYFILDCKDLDEALEWAAKIPISCGGGTGSIEVRPIREMPAHVESSEQVETTRRWTT
jgi:hypothetical protein